MMRRLEPALLGVLAMLVVVGVSVRILALPFATEAMFHAAGGGAESDLEADVALRVAESVRAYVVGAGVDTLPAQVSGREGFTASAVSHLDDVRRVFAAGMWATALCLAAGAVWAFVRVRAGEVARVRVAAVWGGGFVLVFVAIAAAVAVTDFERFFAGFHALFFEAGTWQFPKGDLLIQLFPEPFWALAGALWGAMVALGGIGLLLAGLLPRRARARDVSAKKA